MKTDWLTPPEVVEASRNALGGKIDLDPCSHPKSIVAARKAVLLPEDGLSVEWAGGVFCNPPFDDIMRWARKCHTHSYMGGNSAILLIPANVEQPHWHEVIFPNASAVCFFRKRLTYIDGETCIRERSPRFASAAVFFGWDHGAAKRFGEAFCHLGSIVHPGDYGR